MALWNTSIRLPQELQRKVKVRCAENGISINDVAKKLISEFASGRINVILDSNSAIVVCYHEKISPERTCLDCGYQQLV